MKILFVVPYPEGEAPSQRFRFEQYFDLLKAEGLQYELAPFLDLGTWRVLYQRGNTLKKVLGIFKGFGRRLKLLFRLHRYDWVFIHREAAPIGPPIFEWLMARVFKKRLIYDFDDAIWLPNTSEQNSIAARLKWHQKVSAICRWSYRVSCGNGYLTNWARQHNQQVVMNPTTIDTETLHNRIKQHQSGPVTIGWTGTHSTLKYLKPLEGVLIRLADKYPQLRVLIISNQAPDLKIPRLEFRSWQKHTEVGDLLQIDIGIMPLSPDRWSEGKCGFKALQYMALGIPAVISPVGVNNQIITHGIEGFLADSPEAWEEQLSLLITNTELRQEMGKRARERVVNGYSVFSNRTTFLRLFTLS